MGSWKWTARYAAVFVAALLLGTVIAELAVFKQTTLGTPRVSASGTARFLGYGGALIIFWVLGKRIAEQLCSADGGSRAAGFLVLPLTTLITLSAGYDVVLMILRPFLSATAKDVYNWIFVASITAAAVWLVIALYRHVEGIVETLRSTRWYARARRAQCPACSAIVNSDAKFCGGCGKATAV